MRSSVAALQKIQAAESKCHGTPRKLARKKIRIPTKEQFFALIDTIRKKSETKSKPGNKSYEQELAENQQKAKAGADLIEFLAYSGC